MSVRDRRLGSASLDQIFNRFHVGFAKTADEAVVEDVLIELAETLSVSFLSLFTVTRAVTLQLQ